MSKPYNIRRKEKPMWDISKQQFLEDNLTMNPKEIANLLDVSYHIVRCKIMELEMQLKKPLLVKYAPREVEPPKKVFVRPKAEYSNMPTGSALIAKILNEK